MDQYRKLKLRSCLIESRKLWPKRGSHSVHALTSTSKKPMASPLKITSLVFGGSALFALKLSFAARNDVPKIMAAAETNQFDENWRDSVRVIALKSASLMDTEPKPIKTEIVSPSMPPVVMVEEEKPKRRHHVERDICQRHGMRKVYRGRGWRCK